MQVDDSNPLISVVIPCFNQGRFLLQALESVLAQTYQRLEIIVVDDGSTDETPAVTRKFESIRYLRQVNLGLSAARNAGIRNSSGSFLVFLDADDLLRPQALEVGLSHLRMHPECAFVSGSHQLIGPDLAPITTFVADPDLRDPYIAFLQGNYIGMHATVMYRREAFEEAGGFDENLQAAEDYAMYLKIARRFPVLRHGEIVADYRLHDSNMSRDPRFMLDWVLTVLHGEQPYIKGNPERECAYQAGEQNWRNYYSDKLMTLICSVAVTTNRPNRMTMIRPEGSRSSLGFHEIWRHRDLLYFLVWRDIKVKYKQTLLGGAWALLQPLTTMALFSFVFGRIARIPTDGIPYPLFVLSALVPWTYFSTGLTHAAHSLVANQDLIQKIYFPRLLLPISGVLSSLVDFALGIVLVSGIMLYFGFTPGARLLMVMPMLLLLNLVSAGVGFWFAALNVRYRDVHHVLSFFIQLWFFATPIAYPASMVPAPWRRVYGLNPMAAVAEGFRWAFTGALGTAPLVPSVVVAMLLFLSGLRYFQRAERSFADFV